MPVPVIAGVLAYRVDVMTTGCAAVSYPRHCGVSEPYCRRRHRVYSPLADLKIANLFDMLPEEAEPGVRTAKDNETIRSVFVIGPTRRSRRC